MSLVPPWFERDLHRLDRLLAQAAGHEAPDPAGRVHPDGFDGDPWSPFVERLCLDAFERDFLLLALAPDLDPRYGALYLMLIGANRPTAEWALRLLAPTDLVDALDRTAPDARLFRLGILEPLPAIDGTPWLARPLAPHPTVANRLTHPLFAAGDPGDLPLPQATKTQIKRLTQLPQGSVIHLECADPALRQRCARAIAGLRGISDDPMEAMVTGTALYSESLPTDPALYSLVLTYGPEPNAPHRHLSVPVLDSKRREDVWRDALLRHRIKADPADVSTRFALNLDQIESAAAWVAARTAAPNLLEAAAAQTVGAIAELAQEVKEDRGWSDLVVPASTGRRLRTIGSAIEMRHRVFEEWGFGRRRGGNGLNVLFAGPSGSGKTMAAGIIGREIGLKVFRIDLATTVSKYIGETEKNLARIFEAADRSGAILFFDEADSLFGKRSEVTNAHDRYANLEISYLLQRMEDYKGAAILATNLARNLDEAFMRRLHYVVEFPVPDAELRRRIWGAIFPTATPVGDVDLDFVAERFELTGGRIANVALDAAFMAAREGIRIGMRHLMGAIAHEWTKSGRIPSPSDFGPYYEAAISSSLA